MRALGAALSSFPPLSLSLSPADLINRGLARCGQMGGGGRMDRVVSIGTTATNHHRPRGSAPDDLLCHASVLSHTLEPPLLDKEGDILASVDQRADRARRTTGVKKGLD